MPSSADVPTERSRITRRRFVRDAGLATFAAADALAGSAIARPSRRGRGARPTVAVFGGGIAGLTAAHELAERGFEVTVYERRAWGGKARSTVVWGSATGGRMPLPGEHAFRAEFGCYQNVIDTMRRIPFGPNAGGVFDNLVQLPVITFLRIGKGDLTLPLASLDPRPYTPAEVIDTVIGLLVQMEIPPAAAAYFAQRMAVFLSSCDARRLGQWERVAWTDFIATDRFGDDYRKTLGALPEFTQASKADRTSAKYVAWFVENWLLYPLLGRGANGPVLRVLNAPTNEAWIDPWLARLSKLGARLRLNHELSGLEFRHGRICAAHIRTPRGARSVVADYYVCALPVERARRQWSRAILDADPALANMRHLGTGLMNGIMFYLRERSQIVTGGAGCTDSPWTLTFIPQAQFWPVDFASRYGDGAVHDKLSVAIADFTRPGILFGKPARDCTPEEFARECWEQIKQHVNKPGRAAKLTDELLHSWNIDPGLTARRGHLVSEDALILPTAGTEQFRPSPTTRIPNLMLCGDYLDGQWEVASMEAASFNGRRAANAILEAAGSFEAPAKTVGPYRPPEWQPLKRIDEDRYRRGQPNLFDSDVTTEQLNALLSRVRV